MSRLIQYPMSLIGTTWLVSEKQERFAPFYINFNSEGVASAVHASGVSTGFFRWFEEDDVVSFSGKFNTTSEGIFEFMGSTEGGGGQYTYTWAQGKLMIGYFSMEVHQL